MAFAHVSLIATLSTVPARCKNGICPTIRDGTACITQNSFLHHTCEHLHLRSQSGVFLAATSSSPQSPCARRRASTLTMASLDDCARLWEHICSSHATLLSGYMRPGTVHSTWAQRDLQRSRKRIYSVVRPYPSAFNNESPADHSHSAIAHTELHTAFTKYHSPSGTRLLKIFEEDADDAKGTPVEVWDAVAGILEATWVVPRDVHGPLYTDERLGGLAWSPNETHVLYIADRPIVRAKGDEDTEVPWRRDLDREFDADAGGMFGECFGNKRAPVLVVANVMSGEVRVVGSLPDGAFFGDPQWSSTGTQWAATMIPQEAVFEQGGKKIVCKKPYMLGLRYCYNRYSEIITFDVPTEFSADLREVTDIGNTLKVVSENRTDRTDFGCFSPRFSPDGQLLVYLSVQNKHISGIESEFLPHDSAKVLRAVYIREGSCSKPVTVVQVPDTASFEKFPGIFTGGLPPRTFLDERTIAFSTIWGSVNRVVTVSISESGADCLLQEMRPSRVSVEDRSAEDIDEFENLNVTVLDVCERKILAGFSSPGVPHRIMMLTKPTDPSEQQFKVECLSKLSKKGVELANDCDKVITKTLVATCEAHPPVPKVGRAAKEFDGSVENAPKCYQVTLILPKIDRSQGKIPLIVYPHGGPHTTTVNGFSPSTAAMLRTGKAVMYINYRGSAGLGQRSLESLLGNIGSQEINEVMEATAWALSKPEHNLDKDRVGFVGGSHSGFIGAHTSLYPELFKRTVLRNPVTNIASMCGTSDIPDWCFSETKQSVSEEHGLHLAADPSQLAKMYDHSPASRVRILEDPKRRPGPTMLLVGGVDRRVPPQQSIEWKRIMTEAYGKDAVKIRWYPDSAHAIDEVPNGDDAWVQTLHFLDKL